MTDVIRINRAPVLTLWAAVVAERLGQDWSTALTLGRAVSGLNAYSKGKRIGIYEERPEKETEKERRPAESTPEATIEVLGRAVPVVQTPQGTRAVSDGRPINPAAVESYLRSKFGDSYEAAHAALGELAASYPPPELARRAYDLYEQFRPAIPSGARGWGAAGDLKLDRVRSLAAHSH